MQLLRSEFRAMGGNNEIVIAAGDEALANSAMADAMQEVLRIERKFSRYRDDSVVSRINAGAGGAEPVPCDPETGKLLEFADALYRQSGGLFDITSGILRRAWNFSEPALPDPRALAALRERIGWERVERGAGGVRLPDAGMELDFGGFGKEYAADRAATLLAERGLAHGYVNLGGDIRAVGPQADGAPWLIGVQDPRRRGQLVATIPVSRGALATSGDYERYFELDGTRYCHVLDPRTGYPVMHWASVTVLAPMAIVAGSYSTIAMLKQEAAPEFLRESRMSWLCIDREGRIFTNRDDEAGPA
jgi:thiamine biosynthesis lipoprotein